MATETTIAVLRAWAPDVIAAAMAKPGVVLKRPVGSAGLFGEHAELPTESLARRLRGKAYFFEWEKIAKVSQPTATRDINDLIKRGILQKDDAGGRSTSYSLIL
jgi:hypothetical protein